eukprot:GHRQ01008738.1.p1 GENE.GHRQ01008738.1~~GHRQ01008738.1.p1  ORF type:complete len:119 (+),score=50.12 GHRQ01008738.1:586-942(+)
MSMYIRVKRQKTTVFLQVEPTDTVLEVKQKLQALLDKAPGKLQLLKEVREASGQYLPLDDAKKLADLKVENDDVVAMAYLKEDGSGYESVKIYAPGAEDVAAGSNDGAAKQDAKQEAQ